MISYTIADTAVTFFAGRLQTVGADHPNYQKIVDLLVEGTDDRAMLVRLSDVRAAVDQATDGKVTLTDDGLFVEGEAMSAAWMSKALSNPDATKVLTVKAGDRVRVEGDEDAPDGIYTVGDVDNADLDKRVYVESEEEFFGFVQNSSIKEVLHDAANSP